MIDFGGISRSCRSTTSSTSTCGRATSSRNGTDTCAGLPIVNEQGRSNPGAAAARKRGVIFDAATAAAASWRQAVPATKQGPDVALTCTPAARTPA